MRVGEVLEIVVVNLVLLALLLLVISDEAVRTAYAAREGLSFVFSRLFLTQVTTLGGSKEALQSPLSLDWIQLLLAAMVVANVFFAYGILERRRGARSPAP